MAELTDIREIVRERYASAAKAAAAGAYDQAQALESESGCCGSDGGWLQPGGRGGRVRRQPVRRRQPRERARRGG